MADSLATLSPVEFAGATLYVVDHEGKPFAPMKAISEAIGLDWASQFTKLKSNTARWGIVEITIPSAGGMQTMICIALYKLAGWLTSISPNKIKDPETRERVIKYQNECDTALWDYWNTGHAIRPTALPATITPEQKATLQELVDLVAATGKQTHAETWVRLHRKMKVNSYHELTADQFDAAVAYLKGKFDDTTLAVIAAKHFPQLALPAPQKTDTDRMLAAIKAANVVSAQVQTEVFKYAMNCGKDWKHGRWMVAFNPNEAPIVFDVEPDAVVMSLPQLAKGIVEPNGMMVSNAELITLLSACSTALAKRMNK